MKTLSIIAAALVSGTAYGQLHNGWFEAEQARGEEATRQLQESQERARQWQAQFDAQRAAQRQQEQLEEIQAAQRQQQYEIYNRQLFEQNRIQRENYLRNLLEDCE